MHDLNSEMVLQVLANKVNQYFYPKKKKALPNQVMIPTVSMAMRLIKSL